MTAKAPETHLQEFAGVLLLAVGTLLFVSLVSYDPHDPSLSSVSSRDVIHNLAGKVGATIADGLFQGIGRGAYLFPIAALILGCQGILHRMQKVSLKKVGGYVFLFTFVPALMDLWFNSLPEPVGGSAHEYLPGGIVGDFVNSFLMNYFNTVGAHIIILAGLLSSLMVVSSLSPLKLTQTATKQIRHLAAITGNTFTFYRERSRRWGSRIRIQRKIPKGKPKILNTPPPSLKQELRNRPTPKQEPLEFMKSQGDYQLPPTSLLSDPGEGRIKSSEEELIANSRLLEKKLLDFHIEGRVTQVHPGPVITLYEFEPAPGVKINQIVNLSDDLALAMRATRVRIVAPIPGKAVVGIEIPNNHREDVLLKEVISTQMDGERPRLPLALGKDIFGNPVIADLATMPHLLVAGTTGSGKSVALNSMIISLLYAAPPNEVKFILIDPKLLELSAYEGIPHLLTPVVVKTKETPAILSHLITEMQNRYRLLAEAGVRNIESYNKKISQMNKNKKGKIESKTDNSGIFSESESGKEPLSQPPSNSPLPYLVVVIDELADLMAVTSRETEDSIARLAQMARAAGIHLIVATQRPSVDVLTGTIKANFPARIAFQVSSKTDSRTILDANGAEQLLGRGDMLFLSTGPGRMIRIHGAYVGENEIQKVTDFIKSQAAPQYVEISSPAGPSGTGEGNGASSERDDLYDKATDLILQAGIASASLIQRRLRVGYPRAARMIEMMEEDGIVGPASGGKPREVLLKPAEEYEDD